MIRNKYWLHSGHRISKNGFSFNRPACKLCGLYDSRNAGYCVHCFGPTLGLSGVYGPKRRNKIGAICRRSRKLYAREVCPNNGLEEI